MEIIIYNEDGKEMATGPVKTVWQKMGDKFTITFNLKHPIDVLNDGIPTWFDLMDDGKCFYIVKDKIKNYPRLYADGPPGFGKDAISEFNFKMYVNEIEG